MTKVFPIFLALFILLVFASCQKQKSEMKIKNEAINDLEVVVNPETPKNQDAGRIVLLEEVMRIRDDGERSVFYVPQNLTIMEDDSLIFIDRALYKYNRNGQIVFKINKQGKGPGEYNYATIFFIMNDHIRLQAWDPPKILDFEMDGDYVKEIRTEITRPLFFLRYINGKIYAIKAGVTFTEFVKKAGFVDIPYALYEVNDNFQNMKLIYDFPVSHYISHYNNQGRWSRRVMFDVAVSGHYLFILNSDEYKIEKFDLLQRKVECIFKRDYKRVKDDINDIEEQMEERVPRSAAPPLFEYKFDIIKICVVNNKLWAITSTTKNDDSQRLVDVFDMNGQYEDNFFLDFSSSNRAHWIGHSVISDDGTYIFIPEQNQEDGLVSIGKYRIKDIHSGE